MVAMNTVSVMVEHYNQPQWLTDTLCKHGELLGRLQTQNIVMPTMAYLLLKEIILSHVDAPIFLWEGKGREGKRGRP